MLVCLERIINWKQWTQVSLALLPEYIHPHSKCTVNKDPQLAELTAAHTASALLDRF